MKKLFTETDSDFCPLLDYVTSFLDDERPNYDIIQLPPIQRNSVWNAAQVERLWDSVLRGFPIGSFLLSPREKNSKARGLLNGQQKVVEKEGYFLLDGQQRTRALLLGFRPTANARLWIDLDPNLSFGNHEFNDRKFLLRYITSHQPWGMDDRIPTEKLGENVKFPARTELYKDSVRYDYQVEIYTENRASESKKYSWPIKSRLPVPLDQLIKLSGLPSGQYREPCWAEVVNLIPQRYHMKGHVPERPTAHFCAIIKAIQNILDTSANKKIRTIVLLYQNETIKEHRNDEKDSMEVLFTRVNAGGTVLGGEEMAYSLLKSSWDGAYEMVSEIVNSKEVGYLLPPTGIVMAATRLARFIMNKGDTPNPGISNFRRWISEKENESDFLATMQSLLTRDEKYKSIFQKVLEQFCKVALYRESAQSDFGIPKKLLLAIKPALYHPVFIWIYKNLENEKLIESNRKTIIRYLIISFITVENKYNGKASKVAIAEVKTTEKSDFPYKEIHEKLIENGLAVAVPDVNEFSRPFLSNCDGFFRHGNDIFNVANDEFNTFRSYFWGNKELLLWFQRAYIHVWFKSYDPMSNDAYDTPYDFDHILPRYHLINSGQINNIYEATVDQRNKFNWNRHLYINSIGNYRMWPFWTNRSDGAKCHTIKLRLTQADLSNDSIAKELSLSSPDDFLSTSSISINDKCLWLDAGGMAGDWPGKRRKAFQQAVENRVVHLYSKLYEEVIAD